MQTTIHSMLEYTHINEMQQSLSKKLSEAQRSDIGKVDSLRAAILAQIVGQNYERAREELTAYVEMKTAFPDFQVRVKRYVQHCLEVIQAIETKRNFPGLATLSLAKQQEIHEIVLEHFDDLKAHLKQIERVERENKLTDVRSTVWVLKAFTHGVLAVTGAALILDILGGQFESALTVTNFYLDSFASFLVNLIPL